MIEVIGSHFTQPAHRNLRMSKSEMRFQIFGSKIQFKKAKFCFFFGSYHQVNVVGSGERMRPQGDFIQSLDTWITGLHQLCLIFFDFLLDTAKQLFVGYVHFILGPLVLLPDGFRRTLDFLLDYFVPVLLIEMIIPNGIC